MKRKSIAAITLCAVMLCPAALASCGDSGSSALQITAVGPYVDDEQLTSYGESFSADSAALSAAGETAEFSSLSVGDESDPSLYGASIMKVDAMIAANEMDIMICTVDEAARSARSDYFSNLEETFTAEELAQIPEEDLLSFDMVDEDGNATGEQTAVCGVRISGNETLDAAMMGQEYGVFLISNTQNPDLAKEVFLEIVNN